jgi:hypothetical protein
VHPHQRQGGVVSHALGERCRLDDVGEQDGADAGIPIAARKADVAPHARLRRAEKSLDEVGRHRDDLVGGAAQSRR